MKGEDIKAGSKPMRSNSKGRNAPAVAAKVVIESKLIPTARPIKGPSPCHPCKWYYDNKHEHTKQGSCKCLF